MEIVYFPGPTQCSHQGRSIGTISFTCTLLSFVDFCDGTWKFYDYVWISEEVSPEGFGIKNTF